MSLPPQIVDLNEYTETINMLVYGDPGTGKTVLAGSDRTLIIACEPGTLSAARFGGAENGAQVWPATTQKDIDEALKWLESEGEAVNDHFDWIAVDSATKMQEIMKRDIVAERVADPGAKSDNPDKVQLDEYGMTQERFKRYVSRFNDLPVNILWTARAMRREDENGDTFVCPDIHGKDYEVAMWFAAEQHAFGYAHIGTVKDAKGNPRQAYQIRWKPNKGVKAKDRFDCLPAVTREKSLAYLRELIIASNEVEDDEPAPAAKK